jgi:hypothetical protein
LRDGPARHAPFAQELPMPDATYDFLIDLIAAQDDCITDGSTLEPHLVELILDRQVQRSAKESGANARR